ncbi:MAG TPA: hypothetical protein VK072_01965 [Candidatus Avamphibacillus sp.]|nr:hypothetical protein [Candidatus Avamphibacillus sp.]
MKKRNVVTFGVMSIISILLFSPRSRQAICRTVDGEAVNKVYELKNILMDWKRNN